MSTRPAPSSASPPRMRIPTSAPLPVPTMIAVGVARPIAHGQAMITTPMNAVSASVTRGSGPTRNQATNVRAATTSTIGTKISLIRSASRWIGRLRALRPLDELHDPGERRVAADVGGPHDERAGRVDRRADDLVAGRLRGRDRLAGEHRFVDRRGALDDDAVDRDLVARADAQEVAGDHRRRARRPPRRRRGSAGPSSPGGR